jgi:phytoene dehydrogenase-like protein
MDTFSYFLSGRPAKETSVQRLFIGSGIIGEDFEKTATYDENNGNQYTYSKLKKMSNIAKLLDNSRVNFNQFYPRDGLKAILNSVLYSLPETIEIKTSTTVEKIITENNTAKGVMTKEGSYFADTIVYSAFAKDLPRYIADLPAFYVLDLNRIKQAKSLTIWLGLDERFEEFNYIGGEVWFKKKPFWAMPISNYNKDFAPRGKKLVGFMFSIDENNSLESEKMEAYNTILRVYPGIDNHIDLIHHQITIPEKAAVAINGFIADTVTPVKNLYLVGTDADDRSMGITRAAYSVVKLIKVLRTEGVLDT